MNRSLQAAAKVVLPFFLVGSLILSFRAGETKAAVEMPAASYIQGLTWLGHASFRLVRGGATVYIDPWKLVHQPHDADLILITHPHFDHLEPADVVKLIKTDTLIVTVPEAATKLRAAGVKAEIREVKPGDKLTVKEVKIEVVPAYNTNKDYHLKANNWVGFIVEVDKVRIYHAGDTDFIPEMKDFKVDVALLPVSGTYVMTAEEAVQAAQAIQPKIAVPMHYGSIVVTEADAQRFQKLSSVVVEIMKKEEANEKPAAAQ